MSAYNLLRYRGAVEIQSTAYRKEIDDIVYEVDGQKITIKAGADVDIGLLCDLGDLPSAYFSH